MAVGLSGDEKALGCSGGPQFRRGVGHLGVLSSPIHRPRFLDPALLVHVRGQTELAAWPIFCCLANFFMSVNIWGVGLRKSTVGR